VALSGELDISNVDSQQKELERALVTSPGRLIFDLGQLRFLDSSGIGLLVRMTSRAASVEVRRPSEIVKQVIECMGLAGVLGMAP
jgi:anti-anti-sigma factor